MTNLITDSQGKVYQKSDTEICYNEKTPQAVIQAIDRAYKMNLRVSVRIGDIETGRDWIEEYDTIGTIGKSTGNIKIPLLILTKRSLGGGALLDDCILKITDQQTKQVLYQAENYQPLNVEIVPSDMLEQYQFNTMVNGQLHGRHKTLKSAQRTKAILTN